MPEDRSVADRELARLRAKAGEQELEIVRLRDEAAEASGELAHLGDEAQELHRHERDLGALVERLRSEARVHEDVVSRLLERLLADERELNDLRAVRDALTPPEVASRPGVKLAASFLPATEGVSGDIYLVAEGFREERVVAAERTNSASHKRAAPTRVCPGDNEPRWLRRPTVRSRTDRM